MRIGARIAAAVVVLGLLAGGCVAVVKHDASAEQRAGFFTYALAAQGLVSTIPAQHRWMVAHQDLVLREGERACTWLRAQPDAPTAGPIDNYTVEATAWRYVHATGAHPIALVTPINRWNIANEAWGFLCPADRVGPIRFRPDRD